MTVDATFKRPFGRNHRRRCHSRHILTILAACVGFGLYAEEPDAATPEAQLRRLVASMYETGTPKDASKPPVDMVSLTPTKEDIDTLFGTNAPAIWAHTQSYLQYLALATGSGSTKRTPAPIPELQYINLRSDNKQAHGWASSFVELIPDDVPVYMVKAADGKPSQEGMIFLYVHKEWRTMVTFPKFPMMLATSPAKNTYQDKFLIFADALNARKALASAIDKAEIKTHFQLIQSIISDETVIGLFSENKKIHKKTILEYHDTLADKESGMFQSNCQYDMGDCEVIIHFTLLPASPEIREQMRESRHEAPSIRHEQINGMDISQSRGDTHIGGVVFGKQILFSIFARQPKGQQRGNISMSEDRLWSTLLALSKKIQ